MRKITDSFKTPSPPLEGEIDPVYSKRRSECRDRRHADRGHEHRSRHLSQGR